MGDTAAPSSRNMEVVKHNVLIHSFLSLNGILTLATLQQNDIIPSSDKILLLADETFSAIGYTSSYGEPNTVANWVYMHGIAVC